MIVMLCQYVQYRSELKALEPSTVAMVTEPPQVDTIVGVRPSQTPINSN